MITTIPAPASATTTTAVSRQEVACRLCVVVPCYNEEEALPETCKRLTALLDRMLSLGKINDASQILLVDDGSRDRTWEMVREHHQADPRIHGLKLSGNRGHQNALIAGLFAAEGDAIVSVDADLQDDVDAIERMVDAYRTGNEVVYGVREDRNSDTFLKRFSAESYYRVLKLLGVSVVFNHADFRLLGRRALDALKNYSEVNLFLRGIVPLIGYRTTTVHYVRAERFAGTSKYPLSRMLALAYEGVTSFSAVPLRMIALLGFLVSLGSFVMMCLAVYVKLFTDLALPGWASSVVPIYFLGGVQLLSIGVLGEYVAKVYLETKRRPRYFIEETL